MNFFKRQARIVWRPYYKEWRVQVKESWSLYWQTADEFSYLLRAGCGYSKDEAFSKAKEFAEELLSRPAIYING